LRERLARNSNNFFKRNFDIAHRIKSWEHLYKIGSDLKQRFGRKGEFELCQS